MERAELFMEPVVIIRAWIWLTSLRVLHFWRRTRVVGRWFVFHGRFVFAQRSIKISEGFEAISFSFCDTEYGEIFCNGYLSMYLYICMSVCARFGRYLCVLEYGKGSLDHILILRMR